MKEGLVDAHLHLQMPGLLEDQGSILKEVRQAGVETLLVNGTGANDWNDVARLAYTLSEVVPFFGVHPWKANDSAYAEKSSAWEEQLRAHLVAFPQAGVGEVGLDKWIRNHNITTQRSIFQRQLEIAEDLGRSASIHCLQAWGHLMKALQESSFSNPFLLHSFGGPPEMIPDFLDRGAFFSISGYFFRPDKSSKLENFRSIPRNRLLLETDAPDMLPPSELQAYSLDFEGKKLNHPANIRRIYEAYSLWSGRDFDEIVESTKRNAQEFLGSWS